MAPVGVESTKEKYSAFLSSFRPEVKRRMRKIEWIKDRIARNEESVLFTQVCFKNCCQSIGLGCSPMARKTGVQSQVKSYQRLKEWYLIPPCLTLSIIRYRSRVKWINPGKGVTACFIARSSSYWKGSPQIDLDYGHQLIYINIYIYIVSSFNVISALAQSAGAVEYTHCFSAEG